VGSFPRRHSFSDDEMIQRNSGAADSRLGPAEEESEEASVHSPKPPRGQGEAGVPRDTPRST
jgi:hypothetical protein